MMTFEARLRLPLIAAPMFLVSGPELVTAACRAGVIGAFPTANCRTREELDAKEESAADVEHPVESIVAATSRS